MCVISPPSKITVYILKPKKSFGQHFLTNESIAARIAQSLQSAEAAGRVLEIGPGQGMLTKYLIEAGYDLRAVEADADMVAYLRQQFPQLEGRLICGSFLRLDLATLFDGQPFAIIGNFPYNISSQILFHTLLFRRQVPELVGMFQREVADRVVAPPGSKTYGVISVLVQAYYQGELLFGVNSRQFNPPPKVKSAVIRLTRRSSFELDCDEKLFRQVVKVTFGQRRKMLRNTLKTFLKGDPLLKDPFFQQRPERLSVDDFVGLTQEIEKRR